MNSDAIVIKGIRQGLLIALREPDWCVALQVLEMRLKETPSFFRGGRVALDVGPLALDRADIEALQTLLGRNDVELWAVISDDAHTEQAAQELGLVVRLGASGAQQSEDTGTSAEDKEEHRADGLVVRRTLRSGQSLRHPGNVVIIGDVNPGAEVVAGGDIVIWGRVQGVVHAGALGDDRAVICALDLAPMQLRIANHIARSPDERHRQPWPEMASVRDEQIVAEPWSAR
ncbi:MAG TPA: septum site-determining protein MinC [Chloroflexi bacterium]|nr:septum site-determining protein MinC [Chloroflexota bacterium]